MKKIYFFLITLCSIPIFSQINISKVADFGANGVLEIPYSSSLANINFQEIFVNNDQSLYLCLGTEGMYHSGLISKFTAQGAADFTFNSSGKIQLNGNENTAFEFIKQDQKILAVYVNDYSENNPDSKMLRFNEDGSQDYSFGQNGILKAESQISQQKFYLSSDNSIFHLNAKLKKYSSNGILDSSFGISGSMSTYANGAEQDGELFKFFKNKNGAVYFNLNHQMIISAPEGSPNQFSVHPLADILSSYYEFEGNSVNPMINPLKMDVTDAGKIAYLFDIQNPYSSQNVDHRFVLLNNTMEPQIFNGKKYLDLQNSGSSDYLKDFAVYNDSFIFVGTKNNQPLITAFQNNGNSVSVNNQSEFSENIAAKSFTKIYIKDNFLYVLGINETSKKAYIVKYEISKPLTAKDISEAKVSFVNPMGNILEFYHLKNQKSIEIFSPDGRKVIVSESAQINISSLNPGNYLIKVNFKNGEVQTFKAIKK